MRRGWENRGKSKDKETNGRDKRIEEGWMRNVEEARM